MGQVAAESVAVMISLACIDDAIWPVLVSSIVAWLCMLIFLDDKYLSS